jgi:SAM-dependent methyltransferase
MALCFNSNVFNIFIYMKIWASSEDKFSLGNWFRDRRFLFFEKKVTELIESGQLQTPVRILDIGGADSFWINRGWGNNPNFHITLVNLDFSPTPEKYSNLVKVIGDATDLNQYSAEDFDIVFSNSVIEHLYNKENQIKMANECRRIGKRYFVQTPNRYFFIEPHYLLPFFQFLPRKLRVTILTKTPLSRGKRWNAKYARQYVDEIRLLNKKEMRELFPKSQLYVEPFFGMAKSFTAYNF